MAEAVKTKDNVIAVNNVSVRIDSREVLQNISFEVPRKSITMLVGPNGSGKTTLVRAIMGIMPVDDGTIRIFGKKPKQIREQIGYVPQRFFVDSDFPITVNEFLSLTSAGKSGRTMKRALAEVAMEDHGSSALSALSGGQLQRVLIARALLGKPKLLVLDEPVSNIDTVGSKSIYEHIDRIRQRYDVTILVVSHEMEVVHKYADLVLCVNQRLLCSGAPQQVMKDKNLAALYGEGATHHHHHH